MRERLINEEARHPASNEAVLMFWVAAFKKLGHGALTKAMRCTSDMHVVILQTIMMRWPQCCRTHHP